MSIQGNYSNKNELVNADIGNKIEELLKEIKKKNIKILIGIDDVIRSKEMIIFTSEFGKWLRFGYPVYLVCTSLYENIIDLCNTKNLTFFLSATTVMASPLNEIRMTEMYKEKLDIKHEMALKLARLTKGYAYAFQMLGVLYYKRNASDTLDSIISKLKTELYSYSYNKIWEELSEGDRLFLKCIIDKDEYKREEVLSLLNDKKQNYSVYRDRLIKKGLIQTRNSYISLALPFFKDYLKEYC